jgi:hypothetical protein
MRERTRILGATFLTIAAGGFAAGCGGGEDVKQAAVSVPVAAAVAPGTATTTAKAPPDAPAGTQRVDDAEADQAFALPDDTELTEKPPAPGAAKEAVKQARAAAAQETQDNFISPGAPSDEQIAAELRQMEAVQQQQEKSSKNVGGKLTLERDGTVSVGSGVPEVVARVVEGANAIAKYPYVYGGGHGSFVDTAYDCSGSLSYALAAGGLLDTTKVSGEFANSGAPGPGKWITIYANAGHTFMVVGGIRYDTSGRGGPLGTRWQVGTRSIAGFKVRHPPGL